MVRHAMIDTQIDLLRTSYQKIAEKSGLVDEPWMKDLVTCCENVLKSWDSGLLLSELRKTANAIRTIKRRTKKIRLTKKKNSLMKNIKEES